ncbi:RNA polymerase sigma factor [Streptomyces sp. NPDC001380]|uniref:RNA polymerase sigma factor n=1 Tax=Streptomyces sp. NPDC001380 TaxID=3364566 RepID=UPI00368F06C1
MTDGWSEQTDPGETAPVDGGPRTHRASYWAFHCDKRTDYLRYAYLQLGSDADAEEAVDATFDKLADKWEQMLRMENLEGYAWTVLKRRIADLLRRRKRQPTLVDTATFEAVARTNCTDQFSALEDSMDLYAAVNALPERQRDAFILRHTLDHSTAQTAALMGVEEATVRSHLRQARRRLAHVLGVECTDSIANGEKTP